MLNNLSINKCNIDFDIIKEFYFEVIEYNDNNEINRKLILEINKKIIVRNLYLQHYDRKIFNYQPISICTIMNGEDEIISFRNLQKDENKNIIINNIINEEILRFNYKSPFVKIIKFKISI